MQYVLPVPPAMFQLCGGDVFMSDFKGLNIFSKSWFWSVCVVPVSDCQWGLWWHSASGSKRFLH